MANAVHTSMTWTVQTITPCFYVGDLPVFGDLVLAPMDGITDSPFRALARQFGSAMSYTEFINGLDIVNQHPYLNERLKFSEEERPIFFQILDNDPQRIVQCALFLRQYEPDGIDINLGCSAKSVVNRGAGAALLRSPQTIAQIFSNLTKILDIPITAKIRLGWNEQSRVRQDYLKIAKVLEDNGAKLIAVHGRTQQQRYGEQADWEAIAEIKQAVRVPVVGNGNVRTPSDIKHMKTITQCDAVMIGRAAIGNPWIFSQREISQVAPSEVLRIMREHLMRMIAFYGMTRGLILFRKHAIQYLRTYPITRDERRQLLTTISPSQFMSCLNTIMERLNH